MNPADLTAKSATCPRCGARYIRCTPGQTHCRRPRCQREELRQARVGTWGKRKEEERC